MVVTYDARPMNCTTTARWSRRAPRPGRWSARPRRSPSGQGLRRRQLGGDDRRAGRDSSALSAATVLAHYRSAPGPRRAWYPSVIRRRLHPMGWIAGLAWLAAYTPAHAAIPAAELSPSPSYFPSVQVLSGAGSAGSVTLRNSSIKGNITPSPATVSAARMRQLLHRRRTSARAGRSSPATPARSRWCFTPAHAGPHGSLLAVKGGRGGDPLPAQLAASA